MTPLGVSTLFTAPQVSDPIRISPGPDGNLWFTEFIGNRVSKITPTGTISRYTIMTSSAFPVAIASDKSAGLVFLEIGKVGRITTGGQVTGEYALPTGTTGIDQEGDVVLGPDGNFWFTNGAESIIRMTPTGTMTRYAVPGTGQRAGGMVVGPDGNLWFTDNAQNFVGRISP
jgi:streptogramin lyase